MCGDFVEDGKSEESSLPVPWSCQLKVSMTGQSLPMSQVSHGLAESQVK